MCQRYIQKPYKSQSRKNRNGYPYQKTHLRRTQPGNYVTGLKKKQSYHRLLRIFNFFNNNVNFLLHKMHSYNTCCPFHQKSRHL